MKRAGLLLLIGLAGYLASGLYIVQPDELAVVRRFGRVVPHPRGPGAHFGLPWGWDRVDRVKPREVKRVSIGPLRLAGEAAGTPPAQFLTGDRNLVNVRATIQYSISDPVRFLLQTAAPDPLIGNAGQSVLNELLCRHAVDDALTEGKQELALAARQRLQQSVDGFGLGVTIRSVDVGAIEPPAEVSEAFSDVINALRERQREINRAQSYARQTIARAEADARQIRDAARVHRDRVVREAEGETQRFDKLLEQYVRSPELTARRLYLETMAETLPRFRAKLIVDSGSQVDLSIIREEQP